MLGVERHTPGYIVKEKLDRDKLKGRAGMRAWKYKRKLEENRGGKLAKACWQKIKGRAKRREAREG